MMLIMGMIVMLRSSAIAFSHMHEQRRYIGEGGCCMPDFDDRDIAVRNTMTRQSMYIYIYYIYIALLANSSNRLMPACLQNQHHNEGYIFELNSRGWGLHS